MLTWFSETEWLQNNNFLKSAQFRRISPLIISFLTMCDTSAGLGVLVHDCATNLKTVLHVIKQKLTGLSGIEYLKLRH